ncbi:MAG: circumsporozoite protein- membrane associated protein, partial [Rhodopirellula sp. JB055]
MSVVSSPRPSGSRTPAAGPESRASAAAAKPAYDTLIQSRIDAARSALWRAELTRQILRGVLVGMAVMLAWIVMDQWIWSPGTTGRVVIATFAIVAAIAHVVRSVWPVLRSSVRADYAARALERDHPELGHALSSYVTLTAPDSANQSASKAQLSKRVVQSIGATTAAKLRSIDALPEEATGLLQWWIATIALLSVLVIYAIASPKNALQSAARLVAPAADIRPANRVQITNVQPGDAEILAGRTVDVSANVRGLRDKETVEFRWLSSDEPTSTSGDGVSEGRVTKMQVDEATANRSTVAHTASIRVSHQATGVQRYEIVAGDAVAGPFEWTIRDTPVVSVTEVQYQPPAY